MALKGLLSMQRATGSTAAPSDKSQADNLVSAGMEHLVVRPSQLVLNAEVEIPSGQYVPPQPCEELPYCPVFKGVDKDGNVVYTVRITGPIKEVRMYMPLIQTLLTAAGSDQINIYIDSPGGLVFTGTTLASLIGTCRATVRTIARGMCASAGSLIWSAGHVCEVQTYGKFMYHMSSHSDIGNTAQIRDRAGGTVEYIRRCLMVDAVPKGHITMGELDRLTNSYVDIWISPDEMRRRIEAVKQAVDAKSEVTNKPITQTEVDDAVEPQSTTQGNE